jgi:oxygen-independent coproporphyrinogen-3 oxidase
MSAPRSLYVHVPFCARRCFYCDFAVHAMREPPVGEWLDAVAGELALQMAERGWSAPLELDTLYVGGGTPSLLGEGAMAALLERLAPHARLAPGAEWTCEANPESFSRELAADWRAAGVNRVSLGVQTFSSAALRWMGRLHGPAGAEAAVEAARAGGIENLSVDLIFGLPERVERDWAADLERVLALGVEHVSLYGLTAEQGAPLGRRVRDGREAMPDDERYAEEFLLAHERLSAAGFEHYEVSNFGLPGRASRHNRVYWAGAPYAALGPGAHGYDPPLRRWNLRGWDAYRQAVAQGRLPVEGEEVVSTEDADLERVWLGLRTTAGVPLAEASEVQRELAAQWVRRGWARYEDAQRVVLSADGWLLLDRLAVEFAAAAGAVAAH